MEHRRPSHHPLRPIVSSDTKASPAYHPRRRLQKKSSSPRRRLHRVWLYLCPYHRQHHDHMNSHHIPLPPHSRERLHSNIPYWLHPSAEARLGLSSEKKSPQRRDYYLRLPRPSRLLLPGRPLFVAIHFLITGLYRVRGRSAACGVGGQDKGPVTKMPFQTPDILFSRQCSGYNALYLDNCTLDPAL
ncbi:hypothetical protein SISSUDRAFT_260541 [Sistotremastrum suecicum HHB10207 ss-3]|uniref:Uncharacterized protein n=1 Tax=Sistotremastrum suecicum HHB10207 ss-3 TaxID=1314776 RepID=A0A166GDS2_9AGAM|nr:hypothetical protein SISSUDRAFT_260541 [Sistotremastrum suecicum HHB10207 ss-3]